MPVEQVCFERSLNERIEAVGRLIEDEQFRIVLRCRNQRQLLPHPFRIGFQFAFQIRAGEFQQVEQPVLQRRTLAGELFGEAS